MRARSGARRAARSHAPAAVLKYADTVIRSFATACSISVLYAVNVAFLGWKANLTYIAGCFGARTLWEAHAPACSPLLPVVFISTYLYMALGMSAPAKPKPEDKVGGLPRCARYAVPHSHP